MCVILVAETKRLDAEMLTEANGANPDGLGMAWRKNGKMRYLKGADVAAVIKLAAEVPLPYIVHARLATVGGKTTQLAHPFPVTANPSLKLSGSAAQVLFHNGHEGKWEEYYKMALLSGKIRPLDGALSDTRVAAALLSTYGVKVFKMLFYGSKWVAFSPRSIHYMGKFVDLTPGIKASNDYFQDRILLNAYYEHKGGRVYYNSQKIQPDARQLPAHYSWEKHYGVTE